MPRSPSRSRPSPPSTERTPQPVGPAGCGRRRARADRGRRPRRRRGEEPGRLHGPPARDPRHGRSRRGHVGGGRGDRSSRATSGATLAIEIVERARAAAPPRRPGGRCPGGARGPARAAGARLDLRARRAGAARRRPRRRRQRDRQDDHDRQDRRPRARRPDAPSCWRPATRSGRQAIDQLRLWGERAGAPGRRPRRWRRPRRGHLRRRSTRRSPAASTSSSPTPPAGSTPSRT